MATVIHASLHLKQHSLLTHSLTKQLKHRTQSVRNGLTQEEWLTSATRPVICRDSWCSRSVEAVVTDLLTPRNSNSQHNFRVNKFSVWPTHITEC